MSEQDGIRLEYQEGIITLRMEIRSNSAMGEFEQAIMKNFYELCESIFKERSEVLCATQGNTHV